MNSSILNATRKEADAWEDRSFRFRVKPASETLQDSSEEHGNILIENEASETAKAQPPMHIATMKR